METPDIISENISLDTNIRELEDYSYSRVRLTEFTNENPIALEEFFKQELVV